MRSTTALSSARPTGHRSGSRSRVRLAAAGLCAVATLSIAACSTEKGGEVASDNNATAAEQSQTDNGTPDEGEQAEEKDNVFAVTKGDCLQLGDSVDGEVKDLEKRDCEEKHDAEVYAETEMTESTFPGPEAASEQAQQFCAEQFEPFIGEKGNKSELKVHFLHPTQASWDQEEDRAIQCIVLDPQGDVTGSLKDSAR